MHELDIDIVHDDVGLELFESIELTGPGHVLFATRTGEDRTNVGLDIPEVAAVCYGLRLWLARQGIDDAQTENMALLYNEEHTKSTEPEDG